MGSCEYKDKLREKVRPVFINHRVHEVEVVKLKSINLDEIIQQETMDEEENQLITTF